MEWHVTSSNQPIRWAVDHAPTILIKGDGRLSIIWRIKRKGRKKKRGVHAEEANRKRGVWSPSTKVTSEKRRSRNRLHDGEDHQKAPQRPREGKRRGKKHSFLENERMGKECESSTTFITAGEARKLPKGRPLKRGNPTKVATTKTIRSARSQPGGKETVALLHRSSRGKP